MRLIVLLFVICVASLSGYPSGSRIPAGNAGEPSTGTPCASCHTVTLNPSGGKVNLTLPGGAVYRAGETQRWTISVSDTNTSWRTGFQLTATAGTFKAATSTIVISSGTKQYVNQSSSASTYTVDWTAPAAASGPITIYLAGAAANTARQTHVYTLSMGLTASGTLPGLRSAEGVVNGASLTAGISAGSWVTIFGSNLAPAGVARIWKSDEVVNGKLPEALEGTSVLINGKAAAVYYVSESQLNVQAPEDAALGAVAVQVITTGGAGTAVLADLRAASPGLFRFDAQNSRYVAAVHADSVPVGPAGLLGTGVTVRAAQPGETILLFGTGFGATTPAVPAGQVYWGAAPLSNLSSLQVRIGGVTAAVAFAGLTGAGLNQFNVVVPELPDGDYAVEASVAGQSVPTVQYLAVKK
jgi:uncharacterized protein (TIGR03437 family)